MTTPALQDPETARALGNVEGQLAEQSTLLQKLHSDFDGLRAELRAVNTRIDRIFLAMLGIGGGLLAALIGIIAALTVIIIRGG